MLSSNRILIVDDDEGVVQTIRDALAEYDFEVEDLRDSRTVLDHLRHNNEYSLLILDVNMPHKDGTTLASQIRTNLKIRTPILLMSGGVSKKALARIRRLGISGDIDYMEKGANFKSESLFDTCISLIRRCGHASKMDELAGRMGSVQDDVNDGMTKITEFLDEMRAKPTVTPDMCEATLSEFEKKMNKRLYGGIEKKVNAKFEKDVLPTIVANAVEAVSEMEPNPVKMMDAVRKTTAWAIFLWAVGAIAAIYGSWLGYTWWIADGAKTATTELRIEQKHQTKLMVQQTASIKSLEQLIRAMPRTTLMTNP